MQCNPSPSSGLDENTPHDSSLSFCLELQRVTKLLQVNMFEFIITASNTVSDMINAAYHEQCLLIFVGATTQSQLLSYLQNYSVSTFHNKYYLIVY